MLSGVMNVSLYQHLLPSVINEDKTMSDTVLNPMKQHGVFSWNE